MKPHKNPSKTTTTITKNQTNKQTNKTQPQMKKEFVEKRAKEPSSTLKFLIPKYSCHRNIFGSRNTETLKILSLNERFSLTEVIFSKSHQWFIRFH